MNLDHSDKKLAMESLDKHPGFILVAVNGMYKLVESTKPVVKKEKKVVAKKVVKTELVDILDTDDNNHITQKEVVEHFVKTKSVKEAVEILDEIDSDNNGRITKKEVRTFVEKNDK